MYFFAAAIAGALVRLTRKCPRCGGKQIVPRELVRRNVRCRFCHAIIIPPDRTPGTDFHYRSYK